MVDRLLHYLSKLPWIVWAAIIPALIILALQARLPAGARVAVVGAGAIHQLRSGDAPEGAYYDLDTRAHESPADTAQRIEAAITEWPNVLVLGFDAAAPTDQASLQLIMARMTQQAENATAVPVVLALTPTPGDPPQARERAEQARAFFRDGLCDQRGLRLCVDTLPYAQDADALRQAVAAAVRDGLARHGALRASTQGGR